MNDFPPDGAFAVDDPYLRGAVSYWVLRGDGLEAWPIGSGSKYGPPRPPRTTPGGSAGQRRDAMKLWRCAAEEYRLEILQRIAANPAEAAARFTRETDRCAACRSYHRAEDLPNSAAAGRGRVEELLTVEVRDAMIADLRRAGHPEALIAQALGIGAKTVNRAARRSGIGAPLRPRKSAAGAASSSVAVKMNPDSTDALDEGAQAVKSRGPMGREQAEVLVRDALLSAVALATRDIEQVEVPVGALVSGSDTDAVLHLLARMLGAVLGVVLPNSARDLLAQIAATAVTGGE
jgi:hypothetical protein